MSLYGFMLYLSSNGILLDNYQFFFKRISLLSFTCPTVCKLSLTLVAMASISSMNIIAGEFSLASLNTSLTILGPSPRYFCTNSDPTTLNKVKGIVKIVMGVNFLFWYLKLHLSKNEKNLNELNSHNFLIIFQCKNSQVIFKRKRNWK